MKNKKGNFTLYIVFAISSIVVIVLATLISPLLTSIATQMFRDGERMYLDNEDVIASIQNEQVRESINHSIQGAANNTQFNIEVLTFSNRYAWVLVTFITALILLILSRRIVETGRGAV